MKLCSGVKMKFSANFFFVLAVAVYICILLVTVASEGHESCQSRWTLMYQNNANGKAIRGNKFALIGAVLSGARVRVAIGSDYYTEAQGLYVRGNQVHAELLNHVSKAAWNKMQTKVYWWWVMVSTTGSYFMTRYYVGGGFLSTTSNSKTELKWFVKPACYRAPVYSANKAGKRLEGSLNDLTLAVKKGNEVRCVSDGSYAFSLNNIALGKKVVAGQSVEHVSKSISGAGVTFQPNAYWWFTIVTTKGTRDMSRWTVGAHINRGHTNDRVAIDWFHDTCWKHLHTHDASGRSVHGLRSSLISAIQSGSRVRIQIPAWGHYTAEADNLSIRNGHVTAQALKHVSKASIEKFQDNAYWYWLMVSTTGTVRANRYDVGAHKHRGDSVYKLEIKWFVDTRPWSLAVSTNNAGVPVSGSKSALIQAVRAGASVRCVQEDGTYAFPAQNLAIHRNEVAAQTLNHVSTQSVPNNLYEMMIQPNAYWWFTIVDTTGRREMSRWLVGEHVSRGHTTDRVGINWFVNK